MIARGAAGSFAGIGTIAGREASGNRAGIASRGAPMSHLPSVYNKVGEMDMLIEGARAAMYKAAGEVDSDHPASWSRRAVAARMIAIENSVKVVDLALRAVGGSSYFKRLPLERLFRDVRAGLYHPFDSDESLEFLGKSAFGLPMMEGLDTE